jgi:hypothetical protein
MFPLQKGVFPQELGVSVMSHLDAKQDLKCVRYVNKEWNRLEGQEVLWKALYVKAFQEQPPEGKHAKVSFFKRCGHPIADINELYSVFTTFWCTLEWEKKKRVECSFPLNPPYSMVSEHSFGPNRGTEEGFEGIVNKAKYYKYVGELPDGFRRVEETKEEAYNMGGDSVVPLHVSIKGGSASYPFTTCFPASIKGVDVGFGNTLGYFSSINDWKKPFKLTCIQLNQDSSKWDGFIPFSTFKFVKIGSDGSIAWECDSSLVGKDRSWHPRSSGRPHTWAEHLQAVPITFPK